MQLARLIDLIAKTIITVIIAFGVNESKAGLVGWWTFDDANGVEAADSSPEGGNHPAMLENGAMFVSNGGRFGGGVSLDGENDRVRIADHSDFEFDAEASFSIAFWFRSSVAFPNTRGFIGKGYDSNPHIGGYYLIRAGGDEIPEFDSRQTSSSSPRVRFDSNAPDSQLSDGDWHHIAVVKDVETGVIRIYYDNGTPVISPLSESSGDWEMGINASDVIIGQYNNRWTQGHFDDVGIWKNLALTGEEIAEIYENGISALAIEDTDGDGLPDDWERGAFENLDEKETGDFDLDGLTNGEEFAVGTDPTESDSDGDGLSDGDEFNIHATDPSDRDTDGDGLTDGAEIDVYSTLPRVPDTDGDGLTDGDEVSLHATKPSVSDSDGDGFSDGVEIAAASDPNDATRKPDLTDLGDVHINEFVACNGGSLLDEDGESSDWIELRNPNDLIPISISGWYLTDDPSDLTKWAFPNMALEANTFLVIFASGKDRAVPGNELHTNFALQREGGYLALTRGNEVGGMEVVHQFNDYAEQFEDVSFGVVGSLDELNSGYFAVPTPSANNDGMAVDGFVADTSFSVGRGFYETPQEVVIATETPGASIVYTLDGTIPTENHGTRVDAPDAVTSPSATVMVSTTTQLRAMAFKEGFQATNVDVQSYIFPDEVLGQSRPREAFQDWGSAGPDWEMDPQVVNHPRESNRVTTDDLLEIPTLSINLPFADLWGSASGIYADANQNVEKFCSIEYFNANGDPVAPNAGETFQVEGTVQIVGGSSPRNWKANKLSLRLKFSPSGVLSTSGKRLRDLSAAIFDKPWIPFGEEATDRFDTLVLDARLNNVWIHPDSSQRERGQYVRDQYIADLQNALGGTAPHGRHMHVYLAGLYWGMFTVHERPDDNFAAEYLGGDKDDYDVIKHKRSTVVAGSADNYHALLDLAERDLSSRSNYEAISEVLDVQDLARYMLVNYYGGNTDWAHHNWYASYNRVAPDGKWRFHSWDAEHVLKDLDDDSTELEDNDDDQGPAVIHHSLMENAEYRLIFADLVRKECFDGGNLTPGNALAHYMRRIAIINEAIRAESARWGDNKVGGGAPHTREDWLAELERLTNDYFPKRTNAVLGQLKARDWYPDTSAPVLGQPGGQVPANFSLEVSSPDGGTIYYTQNGSDPREAFTSNPVGTAYTQPIALDTTALIKARVRRGNEWSALSEAFFIVGGEEATVGRLLISEIHYRPAAPSIDEIAAGFGDRGEFEFIEIFNSSDVIVNLDHVRFSDGIHFDFATDSSIRQLASGQRLLLVENAQAFRSRYGNELPVAGEFQRGSQLANGGERLTLINEALPEGEQTIQDIAFDDEAPWPEEADGHGFSLTLRDPSGQPDSSLASSWRASSSIGGSPGTEDTGLNLATWLASHGLTEGDEHLDQDGDGLLTLLEYGLGTDPVGAHSADMIVVGTVIEQGQAFLTVSYPSNDVANDYSLLAEFSTDLVEWTDALEVVSRAPGEQVGQTRIVVRTHLPLDETQEQFFRLHLVPFE